MNSPMVLRTVMCDEVAVVLVDGILDSSTYRQLRDHIVKAALDEPRAVVVNVSALRAPAPSAYAVFTSARWQVRRWPDIPVLLICGYGTGRDALRRHGITRYVPVYDCLDAALEAVDGLAGRIRQRRCVELYPGPFTATSARELVTQWLAEWGCSEAINSARAIASELVRNVVAHTNSTAQLRVELDGDTVTIAVADDNPYPPALIEMTADNFRLSGLHLVAALADSWGYVPSLKGKTVWATLMSQN